MMHHLLDTFYLGIWLMQSRGAYRSGRYLLASSQPRAGEWVGGAVTGVTGGVTGARVGGATVGGTVGGAVGGTGATVGGTVGGTGARVGGAVGGTGARVGGGVVMVPGPMVACPAHGTQRSIEGRQSPSGTVRLIEEAHRDCGLHRRGHGGGHGGPDGRGHCRGRDRRDVGVGARRDGRLYRCTGRSAQVSTMPEGGGGRWLYTVTGLYRCTPLRLCLTPTVGAAVFCTYTER
jgi:hypothetical protein